MTATTGRIPRTLATLIVLYASLATLAITRTVAGEMRHDCHESHTAAHHERC